MTYFFTYIILPISLLLGLSFFFLLRKKMVMAKVVMAVALAIPFFIGGVAVLIITFWGKGIHKPYDDAYYSNTFTLVNNSSAPLLVNADFSYTEKELKKLWGNSLPSVNFVTYRNVMISNQAVRDSQVFRNGYWFDTPIRRSSRPDWPSQFYITLSDTLGKQLAHFTISDIDSSVCARMYLEITDSLLQSRIESVNAAHGEKGVGK